MLQSRPYLLKLEAVITLVDMKNLILQEIKMLKREKSQQPKQQRANSKDDTVS